MMLKTKRELINRLADYVHDRWSRWQKHLFNKSIKNEDDSYTIPKELVERWQRQMNTLYSELSEKEKASDIKEAKTILKILGEYNNE